MPRRIVLERFDMAVYAPDGLKGEVYDATRQALDDPRFQAHLRRAVWAVVRQQPALSQAQVTLPR